MHIIRKDATIEATGTAEDMPGTFEVILSAPTLDRDGDTLLPAEWKLPLPEHITFDSDHGMSVATTVGSGVPALDAETGNLIVKGTFSSLPRAQEVRTLVNEGHIRTTSVAFMTVSEGKGAGARKLRELLNGAFVAIPSNREALVMSSKGVKLGARDSASDSGLVQTILDAALSLGAAIPEGKSATGLVPMKSIIGSLEATQERALAALREANEGAYVWLRGTIPGDGGGVLVFEVEDPDTYTSDLYRQSYTDDGDAIGLIDDRAPVSVSEVLTPTPDQGDATPANAGDDDDPAAGAEAPAAGSRSAPAIDESAAIQMQAARIRAMRQIASATNHEGN